MEMQVARVTTIQQQKTCEQFVGASQILCRQQSPTWAADFLPKTESCWRLIEDYEGIGMSLGIITS